MERERSSESVLVVLAQPPSGKDKEGLGELVPHKASTLHEHNMSMRIAQVVTKNNLHHRPLSLTSNKPETILLEYRL